MMKNPSFFLAAMLLVGCHSPTVSSSNDYDYSQIDLWLVEWESLFEIDETHYYVLIFSLCCQHCLVLEDLAVAYALGEKAIPLFFIQATPEIPIGTRIEDTFGATTVDEVFIIGWPTLIEIRWDVLIGQSVGEEEVRRKLS